MYVYCITLRNECSARACLTVVLAHSLRFDNGPLQRVRWNKHKHGVYLLFDVRSFDSGCSLCNVLLLTRCTTGHNNLAVSEHTLT